MNTLIQPTIKCLSCEAIISYSSEVIHRSKKEFLSSRKYCSKKCFNDLRQKTKIIKERFCKECNINITKLKWKKLCSSCSINNRKKHSKIYYDKHLKKSKGPLDLTTPFFTPTGYARVRIGRDNKGHIVWRGRARHLMEQKIGRKLETWEEVHHINENTSDDKIENLQILSITKHHQLHGTNMIRQVSIPCSQCGKLFELQPSVYNIRKQRSTLGTVCCSKSCSSTYKMKSSIGDNIRAKRWKQT